METNIVCKKLFLFQIAIKNDQKCSTEQSSSSFLQNVHFNRLMPRPSIGTKLFWTVQIV